MTNLDAQVRAADPDRWLSSRFVADPQTRADLIALYAFEAELAAIPRRVSQPLLAEMRLTWWADQMEGVVSGDPRKGHPALEALSAAVLRHALLRAPFDAVIEARIRAAHKQPEDIEALYVAPAMLAAHILSGEDHAAAIAPVARLWAARQTGQGTTPAQRHAANAALVPLPPAAFPAIAHVALDPAWPDPLKRLRLTWAVARGRI